MAAKKGVRLITLTLDGTARTGKLAGATVYKGTTADSDKIASFDDPAFTTIPRPVKSYSEFKFTLIDEGDISGVADLSGKVVAVTVSTTYGDGKTDDSAVSVACDMAITGVEPGDAITVDGSRQSTVVVTAVPHCAPAQV